LKLKTSLQLFSSIILLALATYVGTLLFANYFAISAQNEIKTWQQKKIIPDANAWQRAFSSLQRALKFDPNNPEYLNSKATLYLYKGRLYERQSQQAEEANSEALSLYRELVTLRPAWPLYWAGLINIKYSLWEVDEEMQEAMRNAARLGPLFKSNQKIILRAGFHGWPFIDIETREAVNDILQHAMQIQPEQIIKQAIEQGFSSRLQPYLEDDEELMKAYERELRR
jgi:tetratricopeptide (TPR) repeat protein